MTISTEYNARTREPSALHLAALGVATFMLVLVAGLAGLNVSGAVKQQHPTQLAMATAPQR